MNINFSNLVLGNFSSNFIIIVRVGSSLLAVLHIHLFYFLLAAEVDVSPTGRNGELSSFFSQRTIDMTTATIAKSVI